MMISFYQISSFWQILLLVISQLAVISFAAGVVLMFKRKSKTSKQIGVGVVFSLNVILYVLMQLDSRITGAEQGLRMPVPYLVLFVITLLSTAFGAWCVLSETKNRKTISPTSIKEAFDNLPTGVCFFNEVGLPVLCNHAMYRFGFAVCGKDVQYITDLESCLEDDFVPVSEVRKEGKVFVLPDGIAWRLEKRTFTYEGGSIYTQFIATDVTQLHKNQVELQQENEQLRRVQANLRKLSSNVVAVTREEELLNTKMRVHDEMGRCLMAARKYLREDCSESIPDSVASSWQKAVSMIKYTNDTPDEYMLSQIRKTCEYMGVSFVQKGELPRDENVAYILTCAVRECLTNAVRYAGATKLYASFTETEGESSVVVTNNGKAPEGEIVEGGGLSTLRRRIERTGGTMLIQSLPLFKLTVTVPMGKEGV